MSEITLKKLFGPDQYAVDSEDTRYEIAYDRITPQMDSRGRN